MGLLLGVCVQKTENAVMLPPMLRTIFPPADFVLYHGFKLWTFAPVQLSTLTEAAFPSQSVDLEDTNTHTHMRHTAASSVFDKHF